MKEIKEMRIETIGGITLASDYWDCECEQDYIHAKLDGDVEQFCNRCGSDMDDWPNSRLDEVLQYYGLTYRDVALIPVNFQ